MDDGSFRGFETYSEALTTVNDKMALASNNATLQFAVLHLHNKFGRHLESTSLSGVNEVDFETPLPIDHLEITVDHDSTLVITWEDRQLIEKEDMWTYLDAEGIKRVYLPVNKVSYTSGITITPAADVDIFLLDKWTPKRIEQFVPAKKDVSPFKCEFQRDLGTLRPVDKILLFDKPPPSNLNDTQPAFYSRLPFYSFLLLFKDKS